MNRPSRPTAIRRAGAAGFRGTTPASPGDRAGERGAATVELVLIAIPMMAVALLVGVVGWRLLSARIALSSVTRDAARIAVTASTPGQAVQLATRQAERTAGDYRLDPARLSLSVDPGRFARGGLLTVTATYQVALIPTSILTHEFGTAGLTDQHAERIDPYRSRSLGVPNTLPADPQHTVRAAIAASEVGRPCLGAADAGPTPIPRG